MIYKMTLKDSTDEMTFNLLEVPIVDKDIEGAVDNVTLDGNQYTDYLYLKKQYIQKWSIMCDEEYERLRGFYTRQFDEAEIPTYELYYGETIYNDYTLSGEYIYADVQGVEPARMSLAQLDGNATQTTYSGKNLMTPRKAESTNATVADDGKISYNKTAITTYINLTKATDALVLEAGTYTFSISQAQTGQIALRLLDSNGTIIDTYTIEVGNTKITFTLTTTSARGYIYIRQTTSGTTYTGSFYPMLESGSTASAYEPYVGGTSSPNPSYPQPISTVTGEQTVKVVGKNLFHFTESRTVTSGGVTFETTEESSILEINGTSTSSSNFSTNLIRDTSPLTLEAGTYTIKIDGLNRIASSTDYAYLGRVGIGAFAYMNPSNNWQATFTLTEKTSLYMQGVFAPSTSYDNKEITVQIELGSTATSYQAYTEQSFTIDLGNEELAKIGTYQDRIYKDGEKWYVEKQVGKVVLDGSESWIAQTSNNGYMYRVTVSGVAGNPVDETSNLLSDFFTATSGQAIYSVTSGGYMAQLTVADYIRFNIGDTTNKLADFKTWLGNNPTTVYYALATPTTTEITNQTLIDQLEALTNVSITTGIHNIFTEVASGNLNPVMIFDFIEVVSRRVTLVPETPVRLTLTDGGIINACGCRKDVQLTMRETVE